jgi:cyclic pyranopterin phosphate synthase
VEDSFGRRFQYLRLSLTDVCNFRCQYCLPDGYQKTGGFEFLSVDEIRRVVTAFVDLGLWKVRLTGGEPTLRHDFLDVAKTVSGISGVRQVAVTTNGYRLPQRASDYFKAGITNINISIDSLKPDRFKAITGHDRLQEVMDGIDRAKTAGFKNIKVNAVLLKGINDDELPDFLTWIKDQDLSIRFIELMQTGCNFDYFKKHHLSADVIRRYLLQKGWAEAPRDLGAGPAVNFSHPDYQGRVGLIAPYAKDFCATCNRLRVSAKGNLHLCLFGSSSYSLRPYLQSDDQKELLKDKILDSLRLKKESHFLLQGQTGATPHLASIGG